MVASRHNLPTQTTRFIGRESELTRLAKLIDEPHIRLITILGSGGMGKTRLVLEVAERFITKFSDGVWLVALASVTSPDGIFSAIADAIGYQFQRDGRSPKQQLLDFLREKQVLLLLDNYEHLLDGAYIAGEIFQAAPKAQIIVTSRERLNLSSETVFRLEGMHFADWVTLDEALEYAIVQLFLQSAYRVQPDFDLQAADLPSVARVCRLVEGMPLGIVLAAAWIEMLSPQEIADEITQSFDFLETELRDVPERHRSIRAVFEYSWNLVNGREQEILQRLAVFRGGFTRHAAETVTGASLRILTTLVNKSLLQLDSKTGRFGMHELLRQYVEQQLEAAGEAESARDAHSAYYAGVLYRHQYELKGQSRVDSDALETISTSIQAQFNNSIAAQYRLHPMGQLPDRLTEREVEVLKLVAEGLSNRDIALELVISIATVKTHLNRVFSKLDVKSRTQALIQAKIQRILPE